MDRLLMTRVAIMSLSLSGGLGAILSVFFELYIPQGVSQEQVVQLLTFPPLFIGVGNYIILPLSLAYGRRPTFLGSVILFLLFTIGSAVCNSWEAHLATRILAGVATGATESVSRTYVRPSLRFLDLTLI